tara:strand:- start:62 stop:301 length:240 start_codon:yes stop_codon:yes gene_type:complete
MFDPERLKLIRDSIKDTNDLSLDQMEMKKSARFRSNDDLERILALRSIDPEKATDSEIKSVLVFLAQKDWHFENKNKWL